MRTTIISMVLVLALVQMASAAQSLTMNSEAVDEVTLKTGQICIVHIVSDNSNPYSVYVGFDNRVVLGNFGPTGVYPEAGDLASITEYDIPAFYGYFASAAGTSPPPSPGDHFGITYQPQQVGETELKLYDPLSLTVIAKVHIKVVSDQMGTVFIYQGRLLEAGDPADGQYDFEFKLYNAPSYGIQLASTIRANDFDVINGDFTAELDFGSDVFNGDACWLDISVRPGDSTSSFTSLGPRQRITSTPYSLQTRGIFVDNAGNVGMGTTSPGQELHVYQPIRNVYVRAESDGGYAFFQADGTENSGLRIEENGTLKANVYWNTASQCLSLAYGNDDSLVVKGENVGIGTSSPDKFLTLEKQGQAGSAPQIKIKGYYDGSGGGSYLVMGKSRGSTVGDNQATANGDPLGLIDTLGINYLGNEATATRMMFKQDGLTYSPYVPGRIEFYTSDGGSSAAERMRIDKDGKVGIGTTNPEAELHVEGDTTLRGYLYVEDDLYVSGRYIGSFPRPDYDSGWFAIPQGQDKTLNHNLGGNVDNYVVDMQFRNANLGVHNKGIGGDGHQSSGGANTWHPEGVYWSHLTTTTVMITRQSSDFLAVDMRIRIWVYN